MSEKKTIVGKVIAAILSVFAENWLSFLIKLWKKVPTELKVELVKIVEIIECIKNLKGIQWTGDLIKAAVQGDDESIETTVYRNALKNAIVDLGLVDKVSNPNNYTSSDLHNIGTLMVMDILGLSYGQAAITIENAFQNTKKIS